MRLPSRQDGFQNRDKVYLHSTYYNWRIIGAILISYYISMDVYVVIGCGSIYERFAESKSHLSM